GWKDIELLIKREIGYIPSNISFGLDLASLHRILAPRPLKLKKKKAKVTFGQDIDPDWTDGTRCICRGRSHYLVNYPTIKCEGYSDVRVQPPASENRHPEMFVNWTEMLDTSSKEVNNTRSE
ncbi:hypothetical protein MPER_01070, partial [Moniliophthora perniciosa FA553]